MATGSLYLLCQKPKDVIWLSVSPIPYQEILFSNQKDRRMGGSKKKKMPSCILEKMHVGKEKEKVLIHRRNREKERTGT